MPKIHIDEVIPKISVYPMIVNFQNGYATEDFISENCVLLNDNSNNKKSVATEIGGIVYSGAEENENVGKTLILARNKTTGKVRLIEVGNINLKPILKTQKSAVTEIDNSVLELSRKFGSKKQKKYVEQKEKLKVNVKTVTEQMHNVTVNITEDKLDLSSYEKDGSDDFYIPPIDRQATSASEVYDIYKILSKEQFEKIHSEIENKDIESELQPWLKEIVSNQQLSEEHTVLALYANSLFNLASKSSVEIGKKNFVSNSLSPTLNELILQKFTVVANNRRSRSIPYKDKTFCHGIVLVLLINNLKCEWDVILKNTKYSTKNLMLKLKVIGATVVTSGSKSLIQLKLPLTSATGGRRKSAKF